jgi:predicted aldo/keto reductase-like oxidoreductase
VIEFLDEALEKGKIINAGFSFHGLAEVFKRGLRFPRHKLSIGYSYWASCL